MPEGADETFRSVAAACVSSIRRTFLDHVPLYVCLLAFGATTDVVVSLYRLTFPLGSGLFFLTEVAEALVLVAALAALRQLFLMYRMGRPDNPLTTMVHRLFVSAIRDDRIGNVFHGLVTFTPLMMIFTALKIDIVRVHPFSWDPAFMHMGLALGDGKALWQILQPVLGYPLITTGLSFAYALWFPAMFGSLFWQLSRPRADLVRSQYLLAFALAWFFGGFVIAAVFSSAGPCFYDHVASGDNPYAPLLHYLRETRAHWPVWTVDAQDDLWRAYLTGQGDIQGISAMPSMHVTIATLMALLCWRSRPWLRVTSTVFAVVIVLSSVMLGWHYAVDVFAGAALAFLIWTLAGKLAVSWATSCTRLGDVAPAFALLAAQKN